MCRWVPTGPGNPRLLYRFTHLILIVCRYTVNVLNRVFVNNSGNPELILTTFYTEMEISWTLLFSIMAKMAMRNLTFCQGWNVWLHRLLSGWFAWNLCTAANITNWVVDTFCLRKVTVVQLWWNFFYQETHWKNFIDYRDRVCYLLNALEEQWRNKGSSLSNSLPPQLQVKWPSQPRVKWLSSCPHVLTTSCQVTVLVPSQPHVKWPSSGPHNLKSSDCPRALTTSRQVTVLVLSQPQVKWLSSCPHNFKSVTIATSRQVTVLVSSQPYAKWLSSCPHNLTSSDHPHAKWPSSCPSVLSRPFTGL